VHDAINDPMQNDKIVPWPDVASAFNPPLVVRQPEADGGTPDGGMDGGPGGGGGGGGVGGGGTTSPPKPDSGCSCASASVPGTLLFGLLWLALRNRRRQG
jgi:3-phytase